MHFYVPRIVLIVLLECFMVNLYLYNSDNFDPLVDAMKDPLNITLAVATAIFTVIYLFWLLFAVIRSFSEARKLGQIGQRINMYGLFTMIAIITLMILLVYSYFTGYKANRLCAQQIWIILNCRKHIPDTDWLYKYIRYYINGILSSIKQERGGVE